MELDPEALLLADDVSPPAFLTLAESPPIEALLASMLDEARRHRATHLHLEPCGTVRLRVAGRLAAAMQLPRGAARALAERLGSGAVAFDGRELAAATLATRDGARAVLHLGERDSGGGELEALGMTRGLVAALGPVLARGGGLVLVAGPARAGKSTTLRALAHRIDAGTRNLLAVEPGDAPAEQLRAILRQDPDAVLIDTVADRQTAALAVQAADAGHLVLAGIAASNAVGAILALRALRVEPFQLASSVRAVLAQRLVRRLCRSCRQPVQAQGSVSALLGFDPGAIVYAPGGCEACGGSGFAGETGVFEAIHADAALRRLINDGGDEAIIARHAFLNSRNLGSAARTLVREGVTTPDEAVRVSRS